MSNEEKNLIKFTKKRIVTGPLVMAMNELNATPTSLENCEKLDLLFEHLNVVIENINKDLKEMYRSSGIELSMSNGMMQPNYKTPAEQELVKEKLKKIENELVKIDIAPLILKYPGQKFKPYLVSAFKRIIKFLD